MAAERPGKKRKRLHVQWLLRDLVKREEDVKREEKRLRMEFKGREEAEAMKTKELDGREEEIKREREKMERDRELM